MIDERTYLKIFNKRYADFYNRAISLLHLFQNNKKRIFYFLNEGPYENSFYRILNRVYAFWICLNWGKKYNIFSTRSEWYPSMNTIYFITANVKCKTCNEIQSCLLLLLFYFCFCFCFLFVCLFVYFFEKPNLVLYSKYIYFF